MHPIVFWILVAGCVTDFVLGEEESEPIFVNEQLRGLFESKVIEALQNWDGANIRLHVAEIVSVAQRPAIDDGLYVEAILTQQPSLCDLRFNAELTKLDIKCPYGEWQLVARRARREVSVAENESTEVDQVLWGDLAQRVNLGLRQLRGKVTPQYFPLTLIEILSIRQRVLLGSDKIYTLEVVLGEQPSRCTLKLYEPASAPERLVVICGQNELSTIIEKNRRRREATRGERQLNAVELHKAANKLKEALTLLEEEKGVRLTLVRVLGGQLETIPDVRYSLRVEFLAAHKRHIMCRAKIYLAFVVVKCGKEMHAISRQV